MSRAITRASHALGTDGNSLQFRQSRAMLKLFEIFKFVDKSE